ncbi:MAG: CDP-6-deoxy-delta-3,4-glucoseen reductase [Gammaproteobacteria bacterium]
MTYIIRLQTTGKTFAAEPEETLLQAAQRHNIDIPYGCQNGACGSCICDLISGSIAYPEGPPRALSSKTTFSQPVVICKAVATDNISLHPREILGTQPPKIKTLPCRVYSMQRLSPDVMQIKLTLPQSESFDFRAGQYIEFLLKDGRKRAFSIANAPHDDRFIELHIRHVDGGSFTGHVFDEMKDKAMMRIEGPLGTFFLREESDRPLLLVGGGTGFAPLKAIIEHAIHRGIERSIHLFWGANTPQDLYLPELPEHWTKTLPEFQYSPVVTDTGANWSGATGLVTHAVTNCYDDLSPFDIYMSGAPAMVEAATPLFAEQGALANHMFSDAFEFASDVLEKIRTRKP